MTNLTQNLILAEYAVKYVAAIMSKGLGPFNRPESVVHRVLPKMPPVPKPSQGNEDDNLANRLMVGLSEFVVGSPKQQWAKTLTDARLDKKREIEKARNWQNENDLQPVFKVKNLDEAEKAILVGSMVEMSGLGNCGEQSYVAFKYLVTKGAPGLAIVDWGERSNHVANQKTGNHMFVVIGMDTDVPKVTRASLVFPPNWGENAVVCDPWYHDWFKVTSVKDWQSRMKRILGETTGIAPNDSRLNLKSARDEGKTKEYAKAVTENWNFNRVVFLPHGKPGLVKLACTTGNELRTLRQMGPANGPGY